jgi:uncharacterized protein YciI|tara:strand:- start:9739 stop:10056 length:318 start_codon:yes stop_codon:yes gene_type:complete
MTDTQQFLYVLKPVRLGMVTEGPNAEESPVLAQHAAYLEDLTEAGTVVLFGRTQNADATGFGLVIFEAESEQAAEQTMRNDPAVQHNLMQATLFPYRIAGMWRER